MRTLLRILFVLMALVGVLLALVYPWFASNVRGYEVGRFAVYDQAAGGWRPAEVALKPADAPVFVTILMHTAREFRPSPDKTVLTIAAATGTNTVIEHDLTFSEGPPTKKSPQAAEATYRDGAGGIETVVSGTYAFTVMPADIGGVDIQSVELLLHAGGLDLDSRAQPAGFVLIALGVIGFVLAFRQFTGTTPRNPNDNPPPKRWGRG